MSAYSWVGPYMGVNLGYQWASATHTDANPNGFAGGIQGGYNWQMGQFVYGFETDLQASGSRRHVRQLEILQSVVRHAARPRRLRHEQRAVLRHLGHGLWRRQGRNAAALSETNMHVGWTAGAGIEVGLTPNWSAKAEYLYVDLSDQRYGMFGSTGFESSILQIRSELPFLATPPPEPGPLANRSRRPGPGTRNGP